MNCLDLERSLTNDQKNDEVQELELKDVVSNVLEEARMVLPGIQALFGFQLVAVFSETFGKLSALDRNLHLVAIILTIVAIAFLMAPAAYHRRVERNSASQKLVDYGSRFLCIGMKPLALSITLDTFVVSSIVTQSDGAALMISSACFLMLFTLWFAFPNVAALRAKCIMPKL